MPTKVLDKADAERLAREANKRLTAIRDAERYEENKGCVGKTYRYRNNFSCPEKPSDYWWLYAKVMGINPTSGHLIVFMFETDKYGQVSIREDQYRWHMNDGYQEIPKGDFNKAWRSLQKKIAATRL